MPPLWLVFLTTLAVVGLLAVAAYHAVNAWQQLRAPDPAVIDPGGFQRAADAVRKVLDQLTVLIEDEVRWRDWLAGEQIEWWPFALESERPRIYDQEADHE